MNDKPVKDDEDDLLDHYDIDFSKTQPNRFAALFGPLKSGGRVVYLEPEIAERFTTSEDVNRLLKALLETIPSPTTTSSTIESTCCASKNSTA